jgi:hypothetical protein
MDNDTILSPGKKSNSSDFEVLTSPEDLKNYNNKKILETILHNIFNDKIEFYDKTLTN